MGLVTAANVADHVIAHRGNADLFWHGALQSLCNTHHNGAAQSKDRTGKAITVTGKDGWPIEVG